MENYRKSFYKKRDMFLVYKWIVFFLLLCTSGLSLYNYESAFILLFVISSLYFLVHTMHNRKLIDKSKAEVSKYHKDRWKWHELVLTIYVVFSIGLIIHCIYLLHMGNVFPPMWWWVDSTSVIIYSESVTISSSIAVGEDGYISGDYFVKYSDIDEFQEEKELNSLAGRIVLVTIWKDKQKLGFDKLFIDEYQKIRLKTYQ